MRKAQNLLDGKPEWVESYTQHHKQCHVFRGSGQGDSPLSLEILGTCRQIHQEAALLPYKGNTFACICLFSLSSFLTALVPAQARAIRSMTLCCTSTYNNPSFEKLLKAKLKGLKKVTFLLQVSDYLPSSVRDPAVGWQHGYRKSVLQFQKSPIVNATVAISEYEIGWRDDEEPSISRQMAREWEKELEEGLLASGT